MGRRPRAPTIDIGGSGGGAAPDADAAPRGRRLARATNTLEDRYEPTTLPREPFFVCAVGLLLPARRTVDISVFFVIFRWVCQFVG